MFLGNSEEQTTYSFNDIQAPWSTCYIRVEYLQDNNDDNSNNKKTTKTIYIKGLVHYMGRWLIRTTLRWVKTTL